MSDSNPLPLQEHLGHLIRRLNQKSIDHFLGQTAGYDLSPPQYAVLVALNEHGESTQRALGKTIVMEASNLHGMLKRMQERSLIQKRTDTQNARKTVISISPKGLDLLETLSKKIEQSNLDILSPLDPKEQKQFLAQLTRVTNTSQDG